MLNCWAILELMGHRRLAGIVSEEELAGVKFIRIDVPETRERSAATQYYSAAAVYAITPTSEATARALAVTNRPQPVQSWELPSLPERASSAFEREDEELLDLEIEDEQPEEPEKDEKPSWP